MPRGALHCRGRPTWDIKIQHRRSRTSTRWHSSKPRTDALQLRNIYFLAQTFTEWCSNAVGHLLSYSQIPCCYACRYVGVHSFDVSSHKCAWWYFMFSYRYLYSSRRTPTALYLCLSPTHISDPLTSQCTHLWLVQGPPLSLTLLITHIIFFTNDLQSLTLSPYSSNHLDDVYLHWKNYKSTSTNLQPSLIYNLSQLFMSDLFHYGHFPRGKDYGFFFNLYSY